MGFAYLLSLVALCTIPPVLELKSEVVLFLDRDAPFLIKQMPDIRISNGEVSIDKKEPYFILDEETGEPVIIIDTTGRTRSLESSPAKFLLTRSSLIVRKNGPDSAETFDLSGVDGITIDRAAIYHFIDFLEEWLAVVIYPFAVLFSFLYRVGAVLFYSLVGKVFCSALRIRLNYRALMRLSAIAVTPATVIGSTSVLLGLAVPLWWMLSWIITTGYLFFGVKSCAGSPEYLDKDEDISV